MDKRMIAAMATVLVISSVGALVSHFTGFDAAGVGSARWVPTPWLSTQVPEPNPTATPGPRPTPIDVRSYKVGAVVDWSKGVSLLEVVQMGVTADSVAFRQPKLGLYGGQLVQAHLSGVVSAVVDLSGLVDSPRLTGGDMVVSRDGSTITIRLPQPTIPNPRIDFDSSSLDDRPLGLISWDDDNLRLQALSDASKALVDKAIEMGIQQEARRRATEVLRGVFSSVFDNVVIEFK